MFVLLSAVPSAGAMRSGEHPIWSVKGRSFSREVDSSRSRCLGDVQARGRWKCCCSSGEAPGLAVPRSSGERILAPHPPPIGLVALGLAARLIGRPTESACGRSRILLRSGIPTRSSIRRPILMRGCRRYPQRRPFSGCCPRIRSQDPGDIALRVVPERPANSSGRAMT